MRAVGVTSFLFPYEKLLPLPRKKPPYICLAVRRGLPVAGCGEESKDKRGTKGARVLGWGRTRHVQEEELQGEKCRGGGAAITQIPATYELRRSAGCGR